MSNGTRGADDTYNHDDISRYGFDGWNPPDGGMLWPTAHGAVIRVQSA